MDTRMTHELLLKLLVCDWSPLNFDQVVILKATSFLDGHKNDTIVMTSKITLQLALALAFLEVFVAFKFHVFF
jgi:hypothetical protein